MEIIKASYEIMTPATAESINIDKDELSVKLIVSQQVSSLIQKQLCLQPAKVTYHISSVASPTEYEQETTVVSPHFLRGAGRTACEGYRAWTQAMRECERVYLKLMDAGYDIQEARLILSNSTKVDLVIRSSYNGWVEFLKSRTCITTHPQITEVMEPLLLELQGLSPAIFGNIPPYE